MTERGFTLIEVLVALAITALVAVIAYGALTSAIGANDSTQLEGKRLQSLDRAFQLLRRDITQSLKRPVVMVYGEHRPAFVGGVDELLLEFTRAGWANSRQQQRSDMQRVRYRVEGDTLWRDYWLHTDGDVADAANSSPLLGGIEELRLRFLDASAGSSAAEDGQWRASWHTRDAADPLPAAVEVVVNLEVWGEVRRVFVLPANG
jgi:general secretion pathway protein J